MPRNGSNIYFIPPGTEGFPDTTIESAKYNSYIHDVETDLNAPRPISAGGTGANNANSALANLGGEKSAQQVTNYDTHVFYPGSFYSAIGATGAPTAPAGQTATHPFVGWVVSSDAPADPPANQNVVIHARNQTDITVPGRVYVREKKVDATHPEGLWGPWSIDGVGVVGPTPPADPPDGLLWWDNISGQLYVWYRDVDSAQWVIASPSPDPDQFVLKGGGDTVTNIIITENLTITNPPVEDTDATNKKYVDDQDAALAAQINQDIVPMLNGKVSKTGDTMTGGLTISGGNTHLVLNNPNTSAAQSMLIQVAGVNRWQLTPWTATYDFAINKFNDAGAWTGSAMIINRASGDVNIPAALSVGSINGVLQINAGILSSSTGTISISPYAWNSNAGQAIIDFGGVSIHDGNFNPPNNQDGGFRCKNGDSNTIDEPWKYFNMFWTGSAMQIWLGRVLLGNVGISSDYRTKKDVAPLPSTWDAVRALKPIKYTQAEFPPASEGGNPPLFAADDIERWGFLAHELQETLVATAATGVKDQANCVQSPNPMPVIAALTKALQEAMQRIEALEAANAST